MPRTQAVPLLLSCSFCHTADKGPLDTQCWSEEDSPWEGELCKPQAQLNHFSSVGCVVCLQRAWQWVKLMVLYQCCTTRSKCWERVIPHYTSQWWPLKHLPALGVRDKLLCMYPSSLWSYRNPMSLVTVPCTCFQQWQNVSIWARELLRIAESLFSHFHFSYWCIMSRMFPVLLEQYQNV